MNSSDLSRRNFIASTASVAAAMGVTNAAEGANVPAQKEPASLSSAVPFTFDRAAFQSVIEKPYAHRQLVAPASFSAATVAMSHFSNSIAAYADPNGFAGGVNSLHCVAVLYSGFSYNMVLDDAMYAKYQIGIFNDEEMRPNDESMRAYWTSLKKNPMAEFLRPLIDEGVSFFVCNNALTSLALQIARRVASKGDAAVTREQVITIHDDLAKHFLPGTMLVPAGVAAVNAAQEARFTYLP
jgi:intracellular sulfur oxidation DsrE/DsrF family protein